MFLGLKELERGRVFFKETCQPGTIEFFDEQVRQAGVLATEGVGELSPALLEILVRGRVQVVMEAPCDRCLERVSFPIDSQFELAYLPASSLAGDEDARISEAEVEAGFYEGDGLDLADVLREQILLALPMQRLCVEECRGICPVCGQNRNRVSCGCQPDRPDDRWSKLREL